MNIQHPTSEVGFRTVALAILDHPNATADQIAGAVDTLRESPHEADRALAGRVMRQRWPTDDQRTADAYNCDMLAGMNAAQIRYESARVWRICGIVAIIAAVAAVGVEQLISIAVDRALDANIEVMK